MAGCGGRSILIYSEIALAPIFVGFDGQRLRGNCEDIYFELRRDLHVAAGVFGRRFDNSNAFGLGCQYRQRPRRWVLVVYLRFALGDFRLIRWAVVDFKIVRARRERRC
jgi:hypothetical protein